MTRFILKAAALALISLAFGFAAPFLLRADDGRFEPSTRSARTDDAVERWRPLLASYADWDIETALRIIRCESKGDPGAVNSSSGAAGLFQAMPDWQGLAFRLFGSVNLLDPAVNVGLAHFLWNDDGGRFTWHWSASSGCWNR